MAQLTKQAYLLKNAKLQFQFVGQPETVQTRSEVLYFPSKENFRCFPGETYNDNQIIAISEALEAAVPTLMEFSKMTAKYGIKIFAKYDTFYEKPRVFANISFSREFVEKITNAVSLPKLYITGTYKVIRSYSSSYNGLDSNPSPGACNFPFPNRHVWAGEQACSIVYYDDDFGQSGDETEQAFNIEGIEVTEKQTKEIFKDVEKMAEAYKSNGSMFARLKYSIILKWNEYGIDIQTFQLNVLDKLFTEMLFPDCVIVASNGKEISCHRNILAVQSCVLHAMLDNGWKEAKTNTIKMEDVSEQGVQNLLAHMYGKEILLEEMCEENLLELLQVAHAYNIPTLERVLLQFLCKEHGQTYTMNGVLAMYNFTVNVDNFKILSEKLKDLMKRNPQKLCSSAGFQGWLENHPKKAVAFVLALLEPESSCKAVELLQKSDITSENCNGELFCQPD